VRRAQLLSMDALVSLVLVIMILGTVSATSESLRSGITSMIGWYERSNIADNMLDVLTKSPGVPEDWEANPSNLKLVGLASEKGVVSWAKVSSLVSLIQNNNPRVRSSLLKLSMGRNFELVLFRGGWNFSVDYDWNPNGPNPPLKPKEFSANYIIPSEEYSNGTPLSPWNVSSRTTSLIIPILNLNGTISIGADGNAVRSSMNSSPWVLYSRRIASVEVFKYSSSVNVTSPGIRLLIGGNLISAVPSYAQLEITLPRRTGYALFVVVDGVNIKLLGVWRDDGKVGGALWKKEGNGAPSLIKEYTGEGDSVTVPWRDIFNSKPAEGTETSVGLWIYSKNLPWVQLDDGGGIRAYLSPRMEPMLLSLWVWGE